MPRKARAAAAVAEEGERAPVSVLAVAALAECPEAAALELVVLALAEVAAGPERLARVAVFGKAAEAVREVLGAV